MNAPSLLVTLAAAPIASEPQILDIDLTVLVMLGLFLVLVLVLTPLFWKPYLRVKLERIRRVAGYREDAARMETDAQARFQRVDQQLAEARRQGSVDLARARAEARTQEQVVIAGAQASAQAALHEARNALDEALAGQRANLDARARQLGHEAAERVLGRAVAL